MGYIHHFPLNAKDKKSNIYADFLIIVLELEPLIKTISKSNFNVQLFETEDSINILKFLKYHQVHLSVFPIYTHEKFVMNFNMD